MGQKQREGVVPACTPKNTWWGKEFVEILLTLCLTVKQTGSTFLSRKRTAKTSDVQEVKIRQCLLKTQEIMRPIDDRSLCLASLEQREWQASHREQNSAGKGKGNGHLGRAPSQLLPTYAFFPPLGAASQEFRPAQMAGVERMP